MFKIFLFDIDGVLIRLPYYYSKVLENEGYSNACEVLNQFYTGEQNNLRNTGKLDPLISVKLFLDEIVWKGSVEEFFIKQYSFEKKYLDLNLLNHIRYSKTKNIKCMLATDQNKHRAKYLLEEMKLKDYFDDWYISCNIGYRKAEKEYWEIVLNKIKIGFPDILCYEICFFDDMECNIKAAGNAGITAYHIKDENDIEKCMNMITSY